MSAYNTSSVLEQPGDARFPFFQLITLSCKEKTPGSSDLLLLETYGEFEKTPDKSKSGHPPLLSGSV